MKHGALTGTTMQKIFNKDKSEGVVLLNHWSVQTYMGVASIGEASRLRIIGIVRSMDNTGTPIDMVLRSRPYNKIPEAL